MELRAELNCRRGDENRPESAHIEVDASTVFKYINDQKYPARSTQRPVIKATELKQAYSVHMNRKPGRSDLRFNRG